MNSRKMTNQQIGNESKSADANIKHENSETKTEEIAQDSISESSFEVDNNIKRASSFERHEEDEMNIIKKSYTTTSSSSSGTTTTTSLPNTSSAISSFTPVSIAEAVYQRGKVKSKTEIMKEKMDALKSAVKSWERNEKNEERKLIPKRYPLTNLSPFYSFIHILSFFFFFLISFFFFKVMHTN